MFNIKNNTVYNGLKKIKQFDNDEDAQSFKNALSIMDSENQEFSENKQTRMITTINEFKKYNENNNEIIDLYNSGMSQTDIATKLNIDIDTVILATNHLGINAGNEYCTPEDEDRLGDDSMSKQYYDRTLESFADKKAYYIEFMKIGKGFKKDRINFDFGDKSYDLAIKWGRENLDNFNIDMITSYNPTTNENVMADKNYTHFAIWKETGQIMNAWNYSDEDLEDLKSNKNHFFIIDIKDQFPDTKITSINVSIITRKNLDKKGIDPENIDNWYRPFNK
jgi:Trp operon repressor